MARLFSSNISSCSNIIHVNIHSYWCLAKKGVRDIFKEEAAHFVGVIPRSDLKLPEESYKRDLAVTSTCLTIEESYFRDDIILLRAQPAAPVAALTATAAREPFVIDLLISSDEEDQNKEKERHESGIDDGNSHFSDESSYNDDDPESDTVRSAWISSSGKKKNLRTSNGETNAGGNAGVPLSKQDLPSPSSHPGSPPITQPEYSRRVYTPMDGETPITIAAKFGLSPESIVRHNRGHFRRFRLSFLKEGETLQIDSPLSACSVVLLPLLMTSQDDINGGAIDLNGVSHAAPHPRARAMKSCARKAPAKKKKKRSVKDSSNAFREREELLKRKRLASRSWKKENEMYGDRTPNDDVPRRIDVSNTNPFDKAPPGSLIPEEDRFDRRLYVCKMNETPTDIAREYLSCGPNPAGRIVYDNRAKHHAMGVLSQMKEGDILILPPISPVKEGQSCNEESMSLAQGYTAQDPCQSDCHENSPFTKKKPSEVSTAATGTSTSAAGGLSASSSAPAASATNAEASAPATNKTSTNPSSSINNNNGEVTLRCANLRGSTSSKQAVLLARVHVGCTVAVYWPNDAEYYPAKVTARERNSDHIYNLKYENGEVESRDLSAERFRFICGGGKRSGDNANTGGADNQSKRRRIEDEEHSENEIKSEPAGPTMSPVPREVYIPSTHEVKNESDLQDSLFS